MTDKHSTTITELCISSISSLSFLPHPPTHSEIFEVVPYWGTQADLKLFLLYQEGLELTTLLPQLPKKPEL